MPTPPLLLRPAIAMALATLLMSLLVGMFLAWAWAIGRLRAGHTLLPTDSPRVVPWGGGSVLAVFIAMISVNFGVSTCYEAMTGRNANTSQRDLMLMTALFNSALLVVVPFILRGTARARAEDFGLEWDRLRRDAGAGFVTFLLIAPIIYGVQLIAVQIWERNEHPVEQMLLENFTGRVAILAIVSAVFIAPAAEELLFRGLFQGWVTRLLIGKPNGPESPLPDAEGAITEESSALSPRIEARSGLFPGTNPYAAPETESDQVETRSRLIPKIPNPVRSALPALLTSSLFALVHMPQWPAPLAIFLLSLGLGLLYQRTGSLVASFALHAAFNGMSTLALILVALNPDSLPRKAEPQPPDAATGAVHAFDAPIHLARRGDRPEISRNAETFSWTRITMADKVLWSRSMLVPSSRPCVPGRTTDRAAFAGDAGYQPPRIFSQIGSTSRSGRPISGGRSVPVQD